MTWIIDSSSKRRPLAKLAAGLVLSAIAVIGTFPGSADARDDRDYRGHYYNGGYYRAPPVVYGSPYGYGYYGTPYYPPPVVYGPGIGISLPFIGIGIR
jgi:hypothetical protein